MKKLGFASNSQNDTIDSKIYSGLIGTWVEVGKRRKGSNFFIIDVNGRKEIAMKCTTSKTIQEGDFAQVIGFKLGNLIIRAKQN